MASTLFLLGIASMAIAQVTPASLETEKEKEIWAKTSNSAGILLDNPIKYTTGSLTYENIGGNFHRPQEGEKASNLSFLTEGALHFEKLYVWGSFNYQRKTAKDALYNASIIDPFRGMPYAIADTNKSDWNYQFFDLSFKVSTNKFNERVYLGIEGRYDAHGGAKQRDPRTTNNSYQLTLNPSVVFAVNENHNLGLNVKYYSFKEESRMENSNNNVDQIYFSLYGLGTSQRHVGKGGSFNYVADSWGGGLHYNFKNESYNLLLSSDYNFKVEDLKNSFSTPKDEGTVKDAIWNTKLQLRKDGVAQSHYLVAEYTARNIDGIEYITQYDNTLGSGGWKTLASDIRSTYKTTEAKLDYDFSLNKGKEYNWKIGAGIRYKKQDDIYILPKSVKNYENLAFQIRGKKNFFLSDALTRRLLIGADFGLSNNLSGEYEYNGGYADYVVVTEFERSDLNYLISDFYSMGAGITYSQQLNEKSQTNLFAKVDFRYTKTTDFEYKDRHALLVSVGCLF